MSFSLNDAAIIGLLAFLEGVLSIDNALVLALLAAPLPAAQRKKALSYGLIGAIVFRLITVNIASSLIHMTWVKFVGGGYLLWLAIQHLWFKKANDPTKPVQHRSFWMTVVLIELTDIAFAVDSILAAVALTPKIWLVFTGGVIGIIMMRFAATLFLGLLKRFPGFENAAYLLILVIGTKLFLEGLNEHLHIQSLDFHHASSPAFWVFWALMLLGFCSGFMPKKTP